MNKETLDHLLALAVDETVDRLLPNGAGVVTDTRLRQALTVLVARVATHTATYELLGIRDSEELAEEWGVSRRRAQAFIASLHDRWGVGRKIGGVWTLSSAEVEQYRPGPVGRPSGSKT